MEYHKVPTYLHSTITAIRDGSVTVKGPDGKTFEVECDDVVNGIGFVPAPVGEKGRHVHRVGDCVAIGNLRTVIWRAWDVCMNVPSASMTEKSYIPGGQGSSASAHRAAPARPRPARHFPGCAQSRAVRLKTEARLPFSVWNTPNISGVYARPASRKMASMDCIAPAVKSSSVLSISNKSTRYVSMVMSSLIMCVRTSGGAFARS